MISAVLLYLSNGNHSRIREQGPSLGVNMAEFEFPAYFNYFVRRKRCTLIVDTPSAETEIRSVFGETLLGPAHFRDHDYPVANVDDDFDPGFPHDRRPNFYKELGNFRAAEKTRDYDELEIDTLIDFVHYRGCRRNDPSQKEKLGVPPQTSLVDFDGFGPVSNVSPTSPPFLSPLSPFLSPLSNNSGGKKRSNSIGLGGRKPTIPFPENVSATRSASTNSSQSTAIEPAPHVAAQRRNSLTSAYSQLSQATSLDSSAHSTRSWGKIQRTNSDGELSKSSRTSEGQASRRSSLGSLEEKPESFRPSSRRVSWTTSKSAAMNSSTSTLGQPSSFRVAKRRDSVFTNYSSRGSTKVSGMTSIDSYDFIMDDEPDRQDTNWMYSQAKWLGKLYSMLQVSIDVKKSQIDSSYCFR